MTATDKLILENNKETIRLLRSGDEAFFDAVYRFYFRGLCAFASQYVPFDESQEIVQDTMMWLWEKPAAHSPDLPTGEMPAATVSCDHQPHQ